MISVNGTHVAIKEFVYTVIFFNFSFRLTILHCLTNGMLLTPADSDKEHDVNEGCREYGNL